LFKKQAVKIWLHAFLNVCARWRSRPLYPSEKNPVFLLKRRGWVAPGTVLDSVGKMPCVETPFERERERERERET
jgi:hypothetical protein